MIVSEEHESYISLRLIDLDKCKDLLNHEGNEDYSKAIFFFVGFQQRTSQFVDSLKQLIKSINLFGTKLVIVSNKPYEPHYTVQNILSDEEAKTLSEIRSYFRKEREEDSGIISKPLWDSNLDLLVVKLILKEYRKLGKDWNKIIFIGFSMGGRYALHLVELLNSKIYALVILKSFITNFKMGESSLESLKKKFLLSQTGDIVEKQLIPIFNAGCYSTIYNSKEEISELFNLLDEEALLCKIGSEVGQSNYLIEDIKVYLHYSLNDPVIKPRLKTTLEILESQIKHAKLSFDDSDTHWVDSAFTVLGQILSNF